MTNHPIFFLCFRDDSLSIISLYQLAYNKKTMYSNYGAFYEVKQQVPIHEFFMIFESDKNIGIILMKFCKFVGSDFSKLEI